MTLIPTLGSIESLFRKLEREAYRAYHEPQRLHKADHFLNFCVTASSLRDYFFERTGKISKADRKPFYELWSTEATLVAVTEIANSAKHFALRTRSGELCTLRTRRVSPKKSGFIEVFLAQDGTIHTSQTVRSDIVVTLSDGQRFDLHSFMLNVMRFWRTFLHDNGIRTRRQAFSALAAPDARLA